MPFGFTHEPIRVITTSAITTFFKDIEVYGAENVPEDGPIIFACTHWNMAVDTFILSNSVPQQHMLHYWASQSHHYLRTISHSTGKGLFVQEPSARCTAEECWQHLKNKNNQKLFLGSFEVMQLGESIGVFPEGTSHTEPHMIPLKDGTSWATLEYTKFLKGTAENGGSKKGRKAVIVPIGIAYTDKAKYRSRVVVHCGQPISTENFEEQFFSNDEGESKIAVKRLTRTLELALWQNTVNAPDWDTSVAAQMAKELLWEKDSDLALSDFVDVSQTLVDIFATTSNERITALKTLLVTYNRLLTTSRLSNAALTDLPLPQNLDPKSPISLPNRFFAVYLLIKDTLFALIRLPFFVVPLLTHLPVYAVGVLGARLAEEELETQAQMKIALGILLTMLTYPILFFTFWAVFRQIPLGACIAAGVVWLLGRYHAALIDDNYDGMKRLVAAWRLLIGLWLPSRFEYQFNAFLSKAESFAPDPPKVVGLSAKDKPQYTRPPRLPSRVLVRHVLRVRIEAARLLASVLLELEKGNSQVSASFWLAERYGGEVDRREEALKNWEQPGNFPRGGREGAEVVAFLRERGARLGGPARQKGDWAASSGGETEGDADH